ncbi:MAG: DUF3577 domain-containing protein [Opitutaceae bacterium]|jgi:hypothetical protein|nr:DUF3577 domain-containing protein [Opitutaceae bacterium]
MATSSPKTTSSSESYFNLITTGTGYLNDIHDVKPEQGDPFLACKIAALKGPKSKVQYVYFDARVSGAEAQKLVRRCIKAVNAKQEVLIKFRLGNLEGSAFTYTQGKNAGKQGVNFKVHLLFISQIKVDGKIVHEPKPQEDGKAAPDVPAANGAPAEPPPPAPESSQAVSNADAPTVIPGDDSF